MNANPTIASRRRKRSALRWLAAGLTLVGVLIAAAGLWVRASLRGSLPQTDGAARVSGLRDRVVVARDARGIPTLRGSRLEDVVLALGYVHAQERFFQMDLMRRRAAGELAALLGPGLVDHDRSVRRHRFRPLAQALLRSASPAGRDVLDAYASGVNQGLSSLAARPWEYLLLRAEPVRWRPEDTTLVVFSMYLELQDDAGDRERVLGVMHDALDPALFEFLTGGGTEWDAPVTGPPLPTPAVPPPPPIAAPQRSGRENAEPPFTNDERAAGRASGSNAWAVSGRLTSDGAALVACDMHLPLSLPNTWFRAMLEWPDSAGSGVRRIGGVTLPGAPAVVAGSNGEIAWGFTNSYGDWSDLFIVEVDPLDADRYLTPDGAEPFVSHRERIAVRGGADVTLDVRWTRWGPIVGEDHRGRPLALRWVAHDPPAANLGILALGEARTVREALQLAPRVGIPAQNLVVGDRTGTIGWTVLGPIPRRSGCPEPRLPHPGRLPGCSWDGYLDASEYPKIVDPPEGLIWTANARVVGGADLVRIGDGGFDLGARARQIRDDLRQATVYDEASMLAIQLDDRALFLSRWRELLLRMAVDPWLGEDPRRAALRRHVVEWGARATVDSVGYRLVREFRIAVRDAVLETALATCRELDPSCSGRGLNQLEGPLWALVESRPQHFLGSRFETWDELFRAAIDDVVGRLAGTDGSLDDDTWGAHNVVRVQHPLSRALPLLSRWIDAPPEPLPGGGFMPRIQGPRFGASERMAVAPGREGQGYLHMPGGQSGHPLSPYYLDGHADWAAGRPSPFLPGAEVHRLTLIPSDGE